MIDTLIFINGILVLIALVIHHFKMELRAFEKTETPMFAFYTKMGENEYLVTVFRITQYSPQGPLYRWCQLSWQEEGVPMSVETYLDERVYAEYLAHAFAS